MCVKRLVQIGLAEEGLFRMAGSATKVKRIKGAFDANLIDDATLAANGEYHRDYDVHVVAGALKCYLRELPIPLLTYTLHQEWLDAARIQDRDQRLKELWSVVQKLPKPNHENLSYLIQFLALLASWKRLNKMTFNNIAIVMAPNLIWSVEDNHQEDVMSNLGRNIHLGGSYRQIVELLIEFSDYFFQERINFNEPKMPAETSAEPENLNGAANAAPPSYVTLPRSSSGHRRTTSSDFNKIDHSPSGISLDKLQGVDCESPKQNARRKKQAAPLPPQGSNRISDSSSPEQQRTSLVPTREAPVPIHPRTIPPPSVSPSAKISSPRDGNVPPTPAVRLHHSGSIRRPNIEPPKPPVVLHQPEALGSQTGTKPPPPRPVPPVLDRTSGDPLGSSIDSSISSSMSNSADSNAFASTAPAESTFHHQDTSIKAPIGFEHLDNGSVDDLEEKVVLRRESRDLVDSGSSANEFRKSRDLVDNGSSANEFRKSLENVIQLQASGQPLMLPRNQGNNVLSSSREDLCDGGGEEAVPVRAVPPVPAVRLSKEGYQTSGTDVKHDPSVSNIFFLNLECDVFAFINLSSVAI